MWFDYLFFFEFAGYDFFDLVLEAKSSFGNLDGWNGGGNEFAVMSWQDY